MVIILWHDGIEHYRERLELLSWLVLGFQLFQHLLRCVGIDLFVFHKSELEALKIKRTLDVQPLAS